MQLCPTCSAEYSLGDPRWRCRFDGHEPLTLVPSDGLRPSDVDASTRSLWRYHKAFRVPLEGAVSLGEGCTPLVPLRWHGREIKAKLDFLTPTGSFKDRGTSLVVSHLRRCRVTGIVEDSSGNAGASFSAYSAAAELRCTIFAPASASPAKLRQIEIHGADLRLIDTKREHISRQAQAAFPGAIYAGHNWQPFFLEGAKTLAYELWEDFGWDVPDAVVVPLGGGANLLGLDIGFRELLKGGSTSRLPRLFGVQARNCAPLADAFDQGRDTTQDVDASETIAEGVALLTPPRARQILEAVRSSGGAVIAVEEGEIVKALSDLARKGLAVEPTSAVAMAGLSRLLRQEDVSATDSVVAVLTGSGLKSTDRLHSILKNLSGNPK